jgi:hypothetical protein
MTWENQTCGKCRFWIKPPPDLMAVDQPPNPNGECRAHPPTATFIPIPVSPTKVQMGVQSGYPSLPMNFPACAKFQKKELNVLQIPEGG